MHETVATNIAKFFHDQGLSAVFVMSGGAALHLIHAFERENIPCMALNHEQSVGFAADGLARATNSPAVAVATSGPGATNLITAIAGAFYDSVPVIFLTGQVSRSRRLQISGLRQYGFQETPFTDIVRPICKKAFLLDDPRDASLILQEAFDLTQQGRPGPVVIDIPDDVQREVVESFLLDKRVPAPVSAYSNCKKEIEETVSLLVRSKRPVLLAGSGVMNSDAADSLASLSGRLGLPIVQTWGSAGLLDSSDPNSFGYFGTHGSRLANFVIQNSDFVISLGCRLDTKATGSPPSSFAREATKVVVEIDQAEIEKLSRIGVGDCLPIQTDVDSFLRQLTGALPSQWECPSEWRIYTQNLRLQLSQEPFQGQPTQGNNPYEIFHEIGESLDDDALVVLDTGLSLPFAMESIPQVKGRRIYHDYNNTSMGWSIGAAIGIGQSYPKRQLVIFAGDGSTTLAMSDLTSLSRLRPGAKLILLDNQGHGMIQQTQDQWFDGKYVASSSPASLHFPDWRILAEATGWEYVELEGANSKETIRSVLANGISTFLHVKIDSGWRAQPQVKFGYPIEDQDPPLPRRKFLSLLKVEPMAVSRERR